MSVLETIIANKQNEVAIRKKKIRMDDLRTYPLFNRSCISLVDALHHASVGIIAEFKRKSPSQGWIHQHAGVEEVTRGYENAGASGISVLTDYTYFGGRTDDLLQARQAIQIPILRKDFMIDAYQIYESKAMGADVILLIAAALTVDQTLELARVAKSLSLEVLLEIHHASELEHINPYVDLVGVNNRNLKTFQVDTALSVELAQQIPDEYIKISESGLSAAETVMQLRLSGYKGFLMGEYFMRNEHPAMALSKFIAACRGED